MAIDPKWKAKYDKSGPTSFARESVEQMDVMRTALSTSYMLFLRKLVTYFPENSKMGEEVQGALVLTAGVIYYMDLVAGKKGRSATAKEIDMLFEKLDNWNLQFAWLQNEYIKSEEMRRAVDSTSKATGVNLDKLNELNKVIGTTMGGLGTAGGGKREEWKKMAPTSYGMASDMGQQLRRGLLGPWSILGEMAWGMGSEYLKSRRTKLATKRLRGFGEQFSDVGIPPEMRDSFSSGRGMGTGVGGALNSGSIGTGFAGLLGNTNEKQAVFPFTTFFDKYAYRTKWTREVLEALKGKKDGTGTSIGDLISGFKSLLPLLTMLGSGLAIVLAGLAGWGVGKWLDPKIKKGVDKIAGAGAYDDFWLGIGSGGKQGKNAGRGIGAMLPGANLWGVGAETNLTPYAQKRMKELGMDTSYMSTDNKIANSFQTVGQNIINSIKQLVTRQDPPATPLYPQTTRNAGDPLVDKMNKSDEENY